MQEVEDHWESVWRDRPGDQMSWHQERPAQSLELVKSVSTPADGVVDVGGGSSRLVDELLAAGYEDLTVLDVSARALDDARARLGAESDWVTWVHADVLWHTFDRTYEVWHDRAMFHFLVDPGDRRRYVEVLADATSPGGHAVIATFGPRGPTMCSGLPVERYDCEAMAETFASALTLERYVESEHRTPAGVTQEFAYGVLVRR